MRLNSESFSFARRRIALCQIFLFAAMAKGGRPNYGPVPSCGDGAQKPCREITHYASIRGVATSSPEDRSEVIAGRCSSSVQFPHPLSAKLTPSSLRVGRQRQLRPFTMFARNLLYDYVSNSRAATLQGERPLPSGPLVQLGLEQPFGSGVPRPFHSRLRLSCLQGACKRPKILSMP